MGVMPETLESLLLSNAATFERDVWNYLVDAPPPPMAVRHLCMLAGQLMIAQSDAKLNGSSALHADGFVLALHELKLGLDWLGGESRLGHSLLWASLSVFDTLERILLDAMVRREF